VSQNSVQKCKVYVFTTYCPFNCCADILQWKLHTALLRPCVCIYRPQEGLKRARSTHFQKEVGVLERRVQWSTRQFPAMVTAWLSRKWGYIEKLKFGIFATGEYI
jgi:hypothetical protein